MGWKQTLILGGAVLLLAACDKATAPIVNVRDGGPTANLTVGPIPPSVAKKPTPLPVTLSICPDPGSGIVISSGEIVVEPCNPLDW